MELIRRDVQFLGRDSTSCPFSPSCQILITILGNTAAIYCTFKLPFLCFKQSDLVFDGVT